MVTFLDVHEQVLLTLQSSSYENMDDYTLGKTLDLMLKRAIASFRFPQMPLTYTKHKDDSGLDTYVFTHEITQREINVLVKYVKLFWLEQQLDNETRFNDIYYDRDVKTFSRGNLMKSLTDRYQLALAEVRRATYDYSTVTAEQEPGLGTIYE